jgi:hypothetical protein
MKRSIYPSDDQACHDISEFLNAVKGLRPRWRALHLPTQSDKHRPYGDEKALWFRGQADISWGLAPRLWRGEYRNANEAEIRLEFESVGQQLTQSVKPVDRWHWYFLMQHYGAPTRLLDWTINPLAALYFAVQGEGDQDAAVWIIDPWRWNRAHVVDLYGPAVPGWKETQEYLLDLEDAFDTDADERQTRKKWPVAIEPPHIDRRIAAQGSKFVLFGLKKNMIDSPAINRPRGVEGKHAIVDRIIISKSAIRHLREELNQIGINHGTMFPDMSGLGRHIAWKWKDIAALRKSPSSPRRIGRLPIAGG